jgi:hypothetical protein
LIYSDTTLTKKIRPQNRINKKEYTLTWQDGRVYGDLEALERAEIENKKDHGNLGIPPSTKSNYLADGNAACFLITSFVFNKVLSAENDWLIRKAPMTTGKN